MENQVEILKQKRLSRMRAKIVRLNEEMRTNNKNRYALADKELAKAILEKSSIRNQFERDDE
jgi:hypothetical protein